jgi:hypothetical protein
VQVRRSRKSGRVWDDEMDGAAGRQVDFDQAGDGQGARRVLGPAEEQGRPRSRAGRGAGPAEEQGRPRSRAGRGAGPAAWEG